MLSNRGSQPGYITGDGIDWDVFQSSFNWKAEFSVSTTSIRLLTKQLGITERGNKLALGQFRTEEERQNEQILLMMMMMMNSSEYC